MMSVSTTKSTPGARRSAARLASVQALYQMDIAGTDLNDVIEQFALNLLSGHEAQGELIKKDSAFFNEVVRGVVRRQREIDPVVDEQLAEGWRLVRVDSTLRAILRAAMFELIDRPDVPVKVVINEYIDVAHAFFGEDEPRVVNGILHHLAERYRPGELKATGLGHVRQ
ncbi:MAG: transcription antitermination factor NusB [Hyphomicrobiaceae bacterium]